MILHAHLSCLSYSNTQFILFLDVIIQKYVIFLFSNFKVDHFKFQIVNTVSQCLECDVYSNDISRTLSILLILFPEHVLFYYLTLTRQSLHSVKIV